MTIRNVGLVIGAIAAFMSGAASAHGQQQAAGALRTEWGHPDLRGTYVRAPGSPEAVCTDPDGATTLPFLYDGITQIRQYATHVAIRNQFDPRSRLFVFDDSHATARSRPPHIRVTWEGETLVAESTHGLHGLEVIERFVRIDAGGLAYELAIRRAATSNSICTIRIPLAAARVTTTRDDCSSCASSATP